MNRIVYLEREKVRKQKLLKEKQDYPERFLLNFGVPKKHLHCTLDTFKNNSKLIGICQNYLLKLDSSILFTGPCGCGKTHLAVSVLREAVKANKIAEAIFTTAPELLLEIRQTFQSTPRIIDGVVISEADVIEKYSNAPFLILDDLGAEKTSEWTITTLYLIIDRRNREEKPTIFTTNMSLSKVEKHLSSRIASRLADCQIIQISMLDYRKSRK